MPLTPSSHIIGLLREKGEEGGGCLVLPGCQCKQGKTADVVIMFL